MEASVQHALTLRRLENQLKLQKNLSHQVVNQ